MKYAVNDTVEVIHTGSTDFGKTGTIRRIVQDTDDQLLEVQIGPELLKPDGTPWYPLYVASALKPWAAQSRKMTFGTAASPLVSSTSRPAQLPPSLTEL